MKCSLGISNFFEEISSLSHSIVFLYFFALITEEGFLISLAILWNSPFEWIYLSFSPLPFASFLFLAICKVSSDYHFAFLHFFFLRMVLSCTSCTMSRASVHSSSGTLSIRSNPLNLFLPSTVCSSGIWFRSYLNGLVVYFLQFDSDFGYKEFVIWATVSSLSCFPWLYRASPSSAAKNIINLISVLTIWWSPCVESSLVLLKESVCYDQCVLLAKL